jgi:hypothetical protein
VTGWLVGRWNSPPVFFDFGGNLFFEGDNVFFNDEIIGTTEEFALQAQEIAANVPDVNPEDVQWMPLGVFALTQDGASAEDATLFLQLAISKEGIIAGTFQNTATDESFEVQGTIDEESQRAAWVKVDADWPIMETGIFNLTENDAGALLHFESGETQLWEMIRLDEQQDPTDDLQENQ